MTGANAKVTSHEGSAARIDPPNGILRRAMGWYMRRRFGKELTPFALYTHSPKLALGYGAFESAFEHSKAVDPKLKMLAELKASAIVSCEWCMDIGSELARDGGIGEEQLRELPTYRESAAFTDTEKLVLDYATAISRTPTVIDDALAARLKAEFSDEQILELTVAAGIENYRARVNQALGVAPQGFSEGAFCIRPEGRTDGAGTETPAGVA